MMLRANPLLDRDARSVIAHRGNRAHAPENTLLAFRQAVEVGVDGIELDVRLTRDGHVVVLHDARLDRTTDMRGEVSELALAEVRAADAGARFAGSQRYPSSRIGVPLLSEVLEEFPEVPLLIEIKTPQTAPYVRQVIERQSAEHRCVAASFSRVALEHFRGSPIPVASATSHVASLLVPALARRVVSRLPFQVMSLPRFHRGIPVPLVALSRAVARAGVPLHVWTVNDGSLALRLWKSGISGILSDDPAAILAARQAHYG